jgi:hypothetical protein
MDLRREKPSKNIIDLRKKTKTVTSDDQSALAAMIKKTTPKAATGGLYVNRSKKGSRVK